MALYVYAATRGDHPDPDLAGIGGAPVGTFRQGRVGALVSELDGEPRPARREVQAHGAVLDRAMRDGPVVPYRFGHLAPGEPELRAHLRAQERELRGLLERLAGQVELLVSLRHDPEQLLREVLLADPRLRRSSERGQADMADRIEVGRALAEAVARRRVDNLAGLVESLDGAVKASVIETVDDEWVRAGLLVPNGEASRVAELARRGAPGAREVRVSGPLPPYHFVAA